MKAQRIGSSVSALLVRWSLPVACLLSTACYDAKDRCGKGERFSEEDQLCVCRSGLTATENGCEKAASTPAAPTDDDDGASGPGDSDAGESPGPAAEPEPSGPEGLGTPCTSNADCAGTEATFCDMLITGGCLVEGCALDGTDCAVGYECQDLSTFGAAGTVCVAATCNVDADDCPDGFTCCAAPIPNFPATCLANGCSG